MAVLTALRTKCIEPPAPSMAAPATRDGAPAIDIVSEHGGFLALQPEWDALFARAALPQQVFQSHVFLRHWAQHYLEAGSRLSIVTARRGGRLVMVWPLITQRRFGMTILRFMGVPVAQFGDVLVERTGHEAELLQAGWAAVRGLRADLFELRKLRTDAALASTGMPGDAILLEQREAPYADLDLRVGREGPSAVYAARERSNHRRRLRRLSERGDISFTTLDPGPQAAVLAAEAIAMKQVALTRHGIVAPTVADPRFAAFFHDLAGDAEGGSPLRIAVIRCDDQAIGIDLALDCKQVSFGHVIATHPDHERGGVGGILVHRSFAAAKARGNTLFDLLAPADAYKLEHADGQTVVSDSMLPLSWWGRLVCRLGLRHLRPTLRAAVRNLPEPVTRRLVAWSNTGKG
ncbi:Acetyltransferase involved in cellulose biosynthesis, CelD/BcsL family [Bosea sp. OK403]|uniref:GNAT family N-acetyltransferase n=1 Tax=Bosea sp. OK403 TaxID=1855286 RepID=UPI0008F00EF8|nr:GNAT family N-acetyltransferase [Bosea sp. OK403]SFJ90263.1 Acetyltransferase involved in cellulose biosynthesis, CelD/BcsL family [Bosea sp. OK403]